jgi:UDP-N-acetylmuramate--alanine ligase
MDISQFDRAYFIGIGGIGMSALARYFRSLGWPVAGYDRTPSAITDQLEKEGVSVHFEDFGPVYPEDFRDIQRTLVVYTPAIPRNHGELLHAKHAGYTLLKRAQVLGMITALTRGLAVAGTHGKTTTSSMLAYILDQSEEKCNAFLGGISANFQTNFVQGDSNWTVVEADEFDRSFLHLHPYASIVTSTDADHLDIYGDSATFFEGFEAYAQQISEEGALVKHYSVALSHPNEITYGLNHAADYQGLNPRVENDYFTIDIQTPTGLKEKVELGLPGVHNAENALACYALCAFLGLSEERIRHGLKTFKGVKRRFEYHVRKNNVIYIDDYAHHPTELKALLDSVHLLYANKKITGIFQPHLYTRTRDFFDGFVEQLSRLDEVIVLPIYPAREEPIPGVSSDALLSRISIDQKQLLTREQVLDYFSRKKGFKDEVILTIGAGDIDRIVEPLKQLFR